jgi:hypothetical protein
LDASAYGDRGVILNGEIGKALGLKILISQNTIPAAAVLNPPGQPALPTAASGTFGVAGTAQISGLPNLGTAVNCLPTTADKVVLVCDPERAGWLVLKREIDMKRWDNPRTDSIELYFFLEYGPKFTITNALYVAYTA